MIELERLSDKLSIPQPVREEGDDIYRKALKLGLVRGRSIVSIMAASLYAAYRITRTPRRLYNISLAHEKPSVRLSKGC